jgi:hypothetical protein
VGPSRYVGKMRTYRAHGAIDAMLLVPTRILSDCQVRSGHRCRHVPEEKHETVKRIK